MDGSKPGNKVTWSPHSLFDHEICHVITLTKNMSVGDWAKVCIQSVDRGEKLMVHLWFIVRIMYPANDIGRVRFNNNMLMMEEAIRGWELNSFDYSSQLSYIGI
jgi:hypothetical protein